ncbi:type I restriction enzyme HsdR N-terminal domain-containing protein [Oceanicaulis sp. LC35]|uniref:type I restriction enzyme HsdR N-terminal domain-containing protein n=1 Tax=Oceanicaulis sp. LC35 TaxID=3349635 RepID=UPI003F85B169
MAFKDKIADVAKRLEMVRSRTDLGEEATKTSIVLPFLSALGYDVFNPNEVHPEFIADVGVKKGEKVDYAVFLEDKVEIIVEAKPFTTSLQDAQYSQLYRYFGVTEARIALLTNGAEFWFFTDIDAPNKMDERPFFKFTLGAYDDGDLRELEKFAKTQFSIDQVRSTAASLKYTRLATQYLSEQMADPEDEFVRLVGKSFYDGNLTAKVVERLKPNVKRAFDDLIRSRVRSRLEVALGNDEPEVEETESESEASGDGIVTTEEELQAFYIIRAIAAEIVDPSRIAIRDQKSYCSVLFDDNRLKPIARLFFDGRTKYVEVFGNEKSKERINIDQIYDVYKFKDKIISIVGSYCNDN